MKYIDRKGNITIEENEQDKFLRHLYNDRGGRLCLKLLIRPFVSKAAGVLLNTRLSARFVPDFAEHNKIDLSLYEKQNFSSWNDFFKRRIRKEEREKAEQAAVNEAAQGFFAEEADDELPFEQPTTITAFYKVVATPEELEEVEMAFNSIGIYYTRRDA